MKNRTRPEVKSLVQQNRLNQCQRMIGLTAMLFGVSCLIGTAHAAVPWKTKPHLTRVGPNLLSADDSEFRVSDGWSETYSTVDISPARTTLFDSSWTHPDGSADSGSFKLEDGFDKVLDSDREVLTFANSGDEWDRIQLTKTITLDAADVAGKTFTLSAYMYSDTWPPPIVHMKAQLYGEYYDKDNDRLIEYKIRDLGDGYHSTVRNPKWQEIATAVTMPDEAYLTENSFKGVRIQIAMANEVDGVSRAAWIDNVYFGEGLSLEEVQTPKEPFIGSRTRVDRLGNFTVFRVDSQRWKPFFPIAIYADKDRTNWQDYADQGFNMNMWASDAVIIERASKAIDPRTGRGMMSGMQIAQYILENSTVDPGTTSEEASRDARLIDLETKINEIRPDLDDDLLLYYWDNEHVHGDWEWPEMVTDEVKRLDTVDGKRMHPIYQLNGQTGVARKYNNNRADMADITGTYIRDPGRDQYDDESTVPSVFSTPTVPTNNLVILDNIEGQQMPVAIAQINRPDDEDLLEMSAVDRRRIDEDFRPKVFAAIAHGARGIGYWKDTYDIKICNEIPACTNTDIGRVEQRAWWNDLPAIRAEIDDMIPLIREPHWTEWSADAGIAPEEQQLHDFGTRQLDGEAYIIAANFDEEKWNAKFDVTGIDYMPSLVEWKEYTCAGAFCTPISHYAPITAGPSPLGRASLSVTIPANGSRVFRLVRDGRWGSSFLGSADVKLAPVFVPEPAAILIATGWVVPWFFVRVRRACNAGAFRCTRGAAVSAFF